MPILNNPNNRKREKPGRFGTDIAYTSGLLTDFTANSTTYNVVATPQTNPASIERISLSIAAAGADADGTMLVTAQKVRGGSGGTITDLTDALSVEAGTITTEPGSYDFVFKTTLVPQDFVFLAGDVLRFKKVSNSAAIDTQASQPHIVAEWAAGR